MRTTQGMSDHRPQLRSQAPQSYSYNDLMTSALVFLSRSDTRLIRETAIIMLAFGGSNSWSDRHEVFRYQVAMKLVRGESEQLTSWPGNKGVRNGPKVQRSLKGLPLMTCWPPRRLYLAKAPPSSSSTNLRTNLSITVGRDKRNTFMPFHSDKWREKCLKDIKH